MPGYEYTNCTVSSSRPIPRTTPFLQVHEMWWYAAIPACGTLMCIYSAVALSSAARGQIDMPREIAKLD